MGTIYIETKESNMEENSIFMQYCKSLGIVCESRVKTGVPINNSGINNGTLSIPTLKGISLFIGNDQTSKHNGPRVKATNIQNPNFRKHEQYDEIYTLSKTPPIVINYASEIKGKVGKRKHLTSNQEQEIIEFMERNLDILWSNSLKQVDDIALYQSVLKTEKEFMSI